MKTLKYCLSRIKRTSPHALHVFSNAKGHCCAAGTLAVYFSPSERSLPDLEISKPAARLKLSDTALRTLLVLEETTCLRVLALDDYGALKQCFWQSPVGGRRFWRDPAAMMLSQ